ncbi:hypothetical protein EB118_14090 [bacterium]|jgi:hypothetical protein|nr:hypothetical protein [bacterium]
MTEQDESKEIIQEAKEVKEPRKKTSTAPTSAFQHPGFDSQFKCLLCGQFRTNLVGTIFCPEYLKECPRFVEDRRNA